MADRYFCPTELRLEFIEDIVPGHYSAESLLKRQNQFLRPRPLEPLFNG